jgi:D-glycero-D-manno-heptose 1,7-bisphosphate phosphatase
MDKTRAVFFDKDGVINSLVDRPDGRRTSPWNVGELKLLPNVHEAMMKVRKAGYLTFIVTNQPGIEDEEMSQEELDEIVTYLMFNLPVNDIYCAIERSSKFYKPNTGMFEYFIKQHDIDRSKSYIIGDRWKDIVPGNDSGLTTILVGNEPYTPDNKYGGPRARPYYTRTDILDACNLIMELDNARV